MAEFGIWWRLCWALGYRANVHNIRYLFYFPIYFLHPYRSVQLNTCHINCQCTHALSLSPFRITYRNPFAAPSHRTCFPPRARFIATFSIYKIFILISHSKTRPPKYSTFRTEVQYLSNVVDTSNIIMIIERQRMVQEKKSWIEKEEDEKKWKIAHQHQKTFTRESSNEHWQGIAQLGDDELCDFYSSTHTIKKNRPTLPSIAIAVSALPPSPFERNSFFLYFCSLSLIKRKPKETKQ